MPLFFGLEKSSVGALPAMTSEDVLQRVAGLESSLTRAERELGESQAVVTELAMARQELIAQGTRPKCRPFLLFD